MLSGAAGTVAHIITMALTGHHIIEIEKERIMRIGKKFMKIDVPIVIHTHTQMMMLAFFALLVWNFSFFSKNGNTTTDDDESIVSHRTHTNFNISFKVIKP